MFEHVEYERGVEVEAANNVDASLGGTRRSSGAAHGKLLRRCLDVLDAGKAAIVIVVVPMQSTHIASEAERPALRVPLEVLLDVLKAIRRDGLRNLAIISKLPGQSG